MAREKIQIRKIDNASARQVTFSKRRRGLFKKAKELSVLCDAEVAVIILSSDKLFEFASSSMKEILERHGLHTKNLHKLEHPSLELQLVEDYSNYFELSKEVAERCHQLRRMRGEELNGLNVDELQQLERSLEAGLRRVMEKKDEKISKEINKLQEKAKQLKEENEHLRQQVADTSNGNKYIATADSDSMVNDEGQSRICPRM